MNQKLSQSILKKIQREQVAPKDRWYFILRRAILWIPGVLAVIIGAFSVSAIIFSIRNSGWEYWAYTHSSPLATIVQTLPYLWIVAGVIFGVLTVKAVRETNTGYRYAGVTLIVASIAASVVIGIFGYLAGIGNYLDTRLGPRFGLPSTIEHQQHLWSQPNEGRLGGYVRKVSDETIRIKGFDDRVWNIVLDDVPRRETVIFNTLIDRNKQIRVIGYIDDSLTNTFHACVIVPFLPPHPGDRIQPPPRPDMQNTMSTQCQDILRIERMSSPKPRP